MSICLTGKRECRCLPSAAPFRQGKSPPKGLLGATVRARLSAAGSCAGRAVPVVFHCLVSERLGLQCAGNSGLALARDRNWLTAPCAP